MDKQLILEHKQFLLERLKNLTKLNKDANNLIRDWKKSSLTEAEQWIKDSYIFIEQNNCTIKIIKDQLLRNYPLELSRKELTLLKRY